MQNTPYILVASSQFSYEEVAAKLNQYEERLDIRGLILQADEAVLVENRLNKKIPIVDEVRHIDKVPEEKLAAIEVALPGTSIRMLSNPYGIATLLGLDADEIVNMKMDQNEAKYPVEKAKGSAAKYTEL